jgi:hypothetical protein
MHSDSIPRRLWLTALTAFTSAWVVLGGMIAAFSCRGSVQQPDAHLLRYIIKRTGSQKRRSISANPGFR